MRLVEVLVLVVKNIITSKELVIQLFKRDFLAIYKKSFLGITWLFISPLIGVVSWVFMHSTGLLNAGDVGVPYPVYVLVGSSIWGLFMGFYTAAEGTLNAGSGFILQIRYPHEALVVKQIAQHIAAFAISFLLNICVMLAFGIIPSWKIVLFPVLILPLLFLGTGIGLVISVFGVVVGEIRTAMGMFLGFMIYLTPVIYSTNLDSPVVQKMIKWNPLTYLVTVPRDAIIYGTITGLNGFLFSSLLSIAVFLLSWKLFYVSEDKVIEKMI